MFVLAASLTPQGTFWEQPIDVVLNQFLISFGWIPIVIVLMWGFIMMWQNYRQGIYVSGLRWVLLAIDVPAATEQSPKAVENLFAQLYGSYSSLTWKEKWIIGKVQPVFSFEIASTEGYIQFYVRTQVRYRDVIEAGIYAQYPDAEITEADDYTSWAPTHFPGELYEVWGSELETKKSYIFPIRTYVEFEDKLTGDIKDPMAQILEGMAKMKPGEHYWYQILVQPGGNDWRKEGEKFINKVFGVEEKHKKGMLETGFNTVMSVPNAVLDQALGINVMPGEHHEDADQWKAFKLTMTEREQVDGVLRKIGKVGFMVKIRQVYLADKKVYDKNARTAFVKGFLSMFTHLNWNYIGLYGHSTPKDDYFWQRWVYTEKQAKLVKGYKFRSWGIGRNPFWMNVEELATLWHFPTIAAKPPLVRRAEAKRGEPPVGLPFTMEEVELPKGPPKPGPITRPRQLGTPPPPEPEHDEHGHGGGHSKAHGDDHGKAGHGDTHAKPHGATHADAHPEPLEATEAPPVHLPGHPSVHMETHSVAVHAPTVQSAKMPHEAEREAGLDATDMGPPADIQLPGPPPGWKPEEQTQAPADSGEQNGGAPPNLPV